MIELNRTPSLYGDVRPSRIALRNSRIGCSPIEYKLSYINNLCAPVTIGWRSGFKFSLPPEPSMTSRNLIIRVEIIVSRIVKNDIQRVLSAVDENSTSELKAMREAFNLQLQENTYGGANIVLDYPISMDILKEYGKTVYLNDLDCVISLESLENTPHHPYSVEGQKQRILENSNLITDQNSFGYSVEIIDNSGRYGDRYLNIGNKVFRVSPRKDTTKQDGVYVLSNNSVENEYSSNEMTVRHYPYSVAEDLVGLYRTADEAMSFGDISLTRKQTLLTLEHDLLLNKSELQKAKHSYETEALEKQREIELRKADREEYSRNLEDMRKRSERDLELERLRLKDHYEKKSYERKEAAEIIKYVPAIITGAIAIFTVMMGIKKT